MTNTEINFFATNNFTDFVKKISIYTLRDREIILESYIDLLKSYKKEIEKLNQYNVVRNEKQTNITF